jgi:hypothetical protein
VTSSFKKDFTTNWGNEGNPESPAPGVPELKRQTRSRNVAAFFCGGTPHNNAATVLPDMEEDKQPAVHRSSEAPSEEGAAHTVRCSSPSFLIPSETVTRSLGLVYFTRHEDRVTYASSCLDFLNFFN